jgi:hypothetical protein
MNVVVLLSNFLEQCGGMLLPLVKVLPFLSTACVSSSSKTRCWRLRFAVFHRTWALDASIWQRSAISSTLINGGGR